MRGAGNPQVNFAVESQMDMMAEALGIDPIDLRLKNHICQGDLFYGQGPDVVCRVESCGTEELLRKGAEQIGWEGRGDHSTDRPWVKRGIGMARGFHTSGAGSPQPSKFILDYSGAIIKMNDDGTAVLINAVADAGGGSLSAHAALAAEEIGLRYEDVIVYMGDTNMTPFDVPTHASRGTYGAGLAVKEAASKMKRNASALGLGDIRNARSDPCCRTGTDLRCRRPRHGADHQGGRPDRTEHGMGYCDGRGLGAARRVSAPLHRHLR